MATPAPPRLTRNVRVLGWVSFFADVSSELLYPIMPLFITSVLGAGPAALGLIEGVAEGTASVMKAVSGRLADRYRRIPMIAGGYGLAAGAKAVIGFATGWPLVLVARFVDRTGKGLRTSPRDAIIAAEAPPGGRGRAFGFHRAADTAGAVVGPLLALALYEGLHHRLRPLFFLAVIPGAVSVALIGLVRERPSPVLSRETAASRPVGAKERAEPLPGTYWRLVAVLTVFGLMNFSDALLILRAHRLGLGVAGIVGVYVLYNLSYAAGSYPAGKLSDRVPRGVVYGVGLGLFAVTYVGLGLVTATAWLWLLFLVYGGYMALTDGIGKAWVADRLPADRLGTGLGVYQGLAGGASLAAGVWAGLAWHGTGTVPLVTSGLVAGVIGIVMVVSEAVRRV